ncbi:hypothetical protein JAK28_15710 [Stenotrophomonas maltophilia]|nr:hypothetical protein [Stenotrophomonas maltophilia]
MVNLHLRCLIALLFAFSGFAVYAPPASAQALSCRSASECDEGKAYAAATAYAQEKAAGRENARACVVPVGFAFLGGFTYTECDQARILVPETFNFGGLCLSRPEQTGWASTAQRVCHEGCVYKLYGDGAGGHYYSTFNDTSGGGYGTCTEGETTPAPTPGGGIDPGEGGGTDPGEGGGTDPGGGGGTDPGGGGGTDPGGGGGTDPEPKPCPEGGKDADGKPCPGEGGGTDPGGGTNPGNGGGSGAGSTSCVQPPICSGDAIQCAQLFQQWRAGCQAEGLGGKVTGDPTNCKAAYQCEGNAIACGQLAVLRKQMCGAGEGDGDGTLTGDGTCTQDFVCTGGDPVACAELKQVHMLRCAVEKLTKEGNGDDDFGEELKPSDFFGIGSESSLEGLDASGWIGRGFCPALNNSVLSQLGVKGIDELCQGASVLAMYVLFLGWLHAAVILGRALTGGN